MTPATSAETDRQTYAPVPNRKVLIIGKSGFVGSAVATHLADRYEVRSIRAPRIVAEPRHCSHALDILDTLKGQASYAALVSSLRGASTLVNCAGLAAPGSNNRAALLGANAIMPALLYLAAADAGASTYIHISSSAVQGRRPMLDESNTFDLITPYATSKALGETLLNACHGEAATRLVIYRATSVQGSQRPMTSSLIKYARLPIVPLAGAGDQPLPLALLPNVAAAIRFLISGSNVSGGCYLHPWEGMTVARLLTALRSEGKRIHVPERLGRSCVKAMFTAGRWNSQLTAIARRAELLAIGQQMAPTSLAQQGFVPPIGFEGYSELAGATS